MRAKSHNWKTGCAVEATLSVIGGTWKPVILFHLLEKTHRFGELSRRLPNATQRMLTLQLRELEADGVVERKVYPEVPPRVEYSLTPYGKSLRPILLGLRDWGAAHQKKRNQESGEQGFSFSDNSCFTKKEVGHKINLA